MNKGEVHRLLKGNFARFLRPFDPFGTWDWWWSGMMVIVWWSWPQFCDKSAPIVGRSGHNRTAIRSHDRESCFVTAVRWRSGAQESPTSPRWDEDRGGSWPPDGDRAIAMCPRNASDRERSWPSTQCFVSRKITTIHAVSPIAKNHICPMKRSNCDEDWMPLAPPRVTR